MICKEMPRALLSGAIACSGLALAFQIAAVAGTWLVNNFSQTGLFWGCQHGFCWTYTGSTGQQQASLLACQAFSILGLLAVAGGLVFGIIQFFKGVSHVLSMAAFVLCLAAETFLAVELTIFGASTEEFFAFGRTFQTDPSFGYGFVLSIVAGIFSVIAAALFAVAGKRQRSAALQSPVLTPERCLA